MLRFVLASGLSAVALSAILGAPAAADRNLLSRLDTDGKPVGTAWSQTTRFDGLTATGMDDVRLVSGPEFRIRASGDARAVAQLRFLIDDGALIVGRLSGPRERFGKTRVEVTAPSLRSITSAGSGSVDVDRIGGERASAIVAGSGRATVRRVEADRLQATIAGSGSLGLTGRSDRAAITISGSGSMTGEAFTAGSADVTVAGSGNAQFRSAGNVRATIIGSGTVTVSGTAACKQTRMGSGRLVCRS